ncbi:hypothetical protein [Azospirillum thermophilum]|uniref:Uncharacterized protein n=1 Tax=Azospirillum thermophilum TaxID=2202148 RepID=A0A2S2CKN5_9PROT|nr:hypothetical protein [Azospirillum thermophilum]AWK85032.1 hypothetical protein DEW08_01500 [Azospirillum thermophilum]
MTPAEAIAALDRALAGAGADVKVFRDGAAVQAKARVRGLRVEELRAGSSSAQAVSRAILSPSPFPAGFLPLRTTDKVLWNGAQRTILSATPVLMGGTPVRIEIDFQG